MSHIGEVCSLDTATPCCPEAIPDSKALQAGVNRLPDLSLYTPGAKEARKLANRLAAIKGSQGGRIYINEQCEFFAPRTESSGMPFVYLGHLDDDVWFSEYDLTGYDE